LIKKLFNPSPNLHDRADLRWECVRRHPEYKTEGETCLRKLPDPIQAMFKPLLKEYTPLDTERWSRAKVSDPLPFPFPCTKRRIKRFLPWQRVLWKFYECWGLCYPIPPKTNNPHPLVLAWLAPRPAEEESFHSHTVDLRVDLKASLKMILSCAKETILRKRRNQSLLLRDVRGYVDKKVSFLESHHRQVLLRVPFRLPIDKSLSQVKALIVSEKQFYHIGVGGIRDRPDQDKRALQVWDLYRQKGRNF